MKLEEMNLEQVTQRLAELDEEVRNANDVDCEQGYRRKERPVSTQG